jgi:hypothetical protein
MPTLGADDLVTALQSPVGEQLSAVTFVMDYWQFAFDGHGLTVESRVTIKGPDWQVRDGAAGFRDRLCERIGHVVTDAAFRPDDCLALVFDDGIAVEASARDSDYRGTEAISFRPRGAEVWGYVV